MKVVKKWVSATVLLFTLVPVALADLTGYTQDFESLDQASPAALSGDGWLVFGNVFSGVNGGYLYGYGPFPAPNGGPAFSAVDINQGGQEQGAQQLVVYSDYDNADHENGNLVEANLFQEQTIGTQDVGNTYTFRFDAKRGDIGGNTTAVAFIKTLDPNNDFQQSNFLTVDTTALPATWGTYEILVTIDQSLVGHFLQIGFASTAANFETSGNYYDNILFGILDTDGDGVPDFEDDFPFDPTETTDTDGDGIGDNSDAFVDDPNEWADTDGDGIGDNSDSDIDGDGVPNEQDEYPFGRFDDATPDYWAFSFIEALARAGITSGCGNNNYCPKAAVTRAQMAVFLERGMNGAGFSPPAATGSVFLDVGAGDFAASFIEQLAADGITAGCGNNNYCPEADVTRAQMAVFLLRAKYGAGYSPPAATGVFNDVDLSYWAVHWIEALAAEGITAGCGSDPLTGNDNYCPDNPVTRDQMAVFLVRTFGL